MNSFHILSSQKRMEEFSKLPMWPHIVNRTTCRLKNFHLSGKTLGITYLRINLSAVSSLFWSCPKALIFIYSFAESTSAEATVFPSWLLSTGNILWTKDDVGLPTADGSAEAPSGTWELRPHTARAFMESQGSSTWQVQDVGSEPGKAPGEVTSKLRCGGERLAG